MLLQVTTVLLGCRVSSRYFYNYTTANYCPKGKRVKGVSSIGGDK